MIDLLTPEILNAFAAISVVGLLASLLTLGSPLILGALGGLCSERSGVINIGLEGMMLSAACATAFVGQASGNPWLGLFAGLSAATATSLLHWLLTQVYSIDHIVSGMGINAVAVGATSLISKTFTELSGREMARFPIQPYWVIAWLAAAAVTWYLRSTSGGLRILAVGNDPEKSRQVGIRPKRIRLQGLLGTGLFTGLAGALIATNAGSFSDNMTAGRGYIALAALILGGWRAWPSLAAALLFGLFESLQLQLQGQSILGQTVPSEFWYSLPYLVTLAALAGMSGRNRAPSGLGQP